MTRSELEAELDLFARSLPGSQGERLLGAERRLLQLGPDPRAVTALIAEVCFDLPADLVLVLPVEDGDGWSRPIAVRHREPGRAEVVAHRLAPVTAPDGLPVEAEALPAPVRQVLAEVGADRPDRMIIAPVNGRLDPIGLLVVGRGGPAFSAADRELVVAVGRRCGPSLELAGLVGDSRREQTLVEMLPDAVMALTPDNVVMSWNAAAERLYGIPERQALGRNIRELITTNTFLGSGRLDPGEPEVSEDGSEGALRAGEVRSQLMATGGWRGRLRQTARTGRTAEIDCRISVLRDAGGAVIGWICVNRDVTEEVAAQAGADLQTRFAQELMDALDSRAAVLDSTGRVVAANSRWRAALTDGDRCACGPVAEGESWVESLLAAPVNQAVMLGEDVLALLHGRRASAQAECRCAAAGPERATAIEVVRVDAGAGGAVVVQSDVTWRRRLQDELSFRATHDELTGLPNRAALVEAIDGALQRLDGRRQLAVLFCDLDGFKDINDGLGHSLGDQVLVAVARRLRQRCPGAEIVARFGGDEFVVVLSVAEIAEAVATADRIVEVLAEPIVVGDLEVAPGGSVGITVAIEPPVGDDPVGTLLRDADTAMYHAKGRGRGRYEFFDASLRENIAERLELAAALHRAVAENELEIVYQTKRTCGDRRIAGVEALLQWQHPALGRIEPAVFIPIAERTGRIVEVGTWVLRRALSEFAAVADPRMTLAVNVSPRQLVGSRLAPTVAAALADSGLEPERLVLEITESALVDDPDAAHAVLTELRRLGVTIALDDFGTGWSSLSYLRTLPVDILKIDRSFVADLPGDFAACAVVSAVLNLGHGMGLVVVAEGAEREDQLTTLREMGCDEYQGFIDGRPGPLAAVLNAD